MPNLHYAHQATTGEADLVDCLLPWLLSFPLISLMETFWKYNRSSNTAGTSRDLTPPPQIKGDLKIKELHVCPCSTNSPKLLLSLCLSPLFPHLYVCKIMHDTTNTLSFLPDLKLWIKDTKPIHRPDRLRRQLESPTRMIVRNLPPQPATLQ